MDLEKEQEIGTWNVQRLFWSGALKMLHKNIGMEEGPENGKESSHSAHANEMNEWMEVCYTITDQHIAWAPEMMCHIVTSVRCLWYTRLCGCAPY